ncbi:ArnT family glycosyltransferase [Microbispora sp. NPDC049125]|uniref:ArnT family glycosyltransferase n=1 Tax=Microbispora sp. NPDC049125 TaxID=3154929 RepID=UPI0034666AC9
MPDTPQRTWSFAVPWPVILVAGLMVALLLALSGAYGFHGDEMYFVVAGRHPAFGYVDQPPLTPLLSAASVGVLGVSPTAVRVLPAVEMTLVVVLVALISRDLGGSRRAQVLAAVTAAVSGYLAAGHLDTTTELDLLAWAFILWLIVRLLAGADRRLWPAVGLAAGIALENKDTLLFLAAGLAVGLVVARRWDIVRSGWAWAAAAIALLLWAPNLAWQAANGWPQLTMASRIAGYAADNRAQIVPLLWLFTGPLLFPVTAAGVAWFLRARDAAPWRAIGIAGPVALGLVVVTGGKPYYAIGSVAVFMAAGSIVVDRWLTRGHARLKGVGFTVAAAASGALLALVTLPILPVTTFAAGSLPSAVPDTANQIGWPQFVSTVEGVVAALPAPERARAVILANDYSEASALVLLGSGLPPVYTGHNAYWAWGPPPARRTVVVHVGDWRPADWSGFFAGCHDVARISNGLGVPNGEQGKAVSVCTGLRASWTTMWPGLRTVS